MRAWLGPELIAFVLSLLVILTALALVASGVVGAPRTGSGAGDGYFVPLAVRPAGPQPQYLPGFDGMTS